jgi:hypothetical protein
MKQTAIEFLISKIESNSNPSLTQEELKERIEQAKKMEKKQHDVTFAAGYDYRSSKEKNIIEAFGMNSKPTFEKYYNETFKK